MIKKIIAELKQFKGKNRLIFISSAIIHAPKIIKDKTVLTLKFIRPMTIIDPKTHKKIKITNYYEYPFYCYDYEDIIAEIPDNSLLLDIGAHFGEVTYRFLREKKGYSYMFEVNPYNADTIERLFSKNKIRNYSLFRHGLGSKNIASVMYLQNPLSYEGSVKAHAGAKKIPVIIKKLDDVILKKASQFDNLFVKMDVEGYELEVIRGMTNFLKNINKNKHITLHIEIKNKLVYKKIFAILKSCLTDVTVKKMTSEDYLFKNNIK